MGHWVDDAGGGLVWDRLGSLFHKLDEWGPFFGGVVVAVVVVVVVVAGG